MFTGFPKECQTFFAMLSFNNTHAFFEDNRALFEDAVKAPLTELARALAPVVTEIDPRLDTRPGRTVSRIHRDVRFSRDKSPYRDYMWVGFRQAGEAREDTCGFYFDLSATAAHWGCGFYHAKPEYMSALREKTARDPARVLAILNDPDFARTYRVMGESYVRKLPPPEDLPEALHAFYRKKYLYAEHALDDLSLLASPALADVLARDFRILAPFYHLMRDCMTPTLSVPGQGDAKARGAR